MRTGLSGSLIILALPVFLKGMIRGCGQRFRRVRRPGCSAALANAARLPVGWLKLNDKLKRIQVQSAFFLPGRRQYYYHAIPSPGLHNPADASART